MTKRTHTRAQEFPYPAPETLVQGLDGEPLKRGTGQKRWSASQAQEPTELHGVAVVNLAEGLGAPGVLPGGAERAEMRGNGTDLFELARGLLGLNACAAGVVFGEETRSGSAVGNDGPGKEVRSGPVRCGVSAQKGGNNRGQAKDLEASTNVSIKGSEDEQSIKLMPTLETKWKK